MKVLVSLPVHECRRVIEDQIRNLTYFFEEVTIIVHLSQSYKEDIEFSAFPNVIVNPTRYPTRWGNIVYLHYANLKYAFERKIPFDYVVFCSSNELYIRKGVEGYLQTADAFLDPRGLIATDGRILFTTNPRSVFYARTAVIEKAFHDRKWHAFLDRYNLQGMVKSQIEGSAYRRDVIAAMLRIIDEELGFPYLQEIGWCGEEILLPTVYLAAAKGKRWRAKRQFSFVDWCHDFTPRMWRRAIRHWRGKRDKGIASYLASVDEAKEVFAIKGVPRTYFNERRAFVRSLLPRQRVDTRGYRRADAAYAWRAFVKKVQNREIVIETAQWALGLVSRAIGKPKGWLKWRLRTLRS